ncbi:pilin N-terminal domain-containing protein [Streptococcus hillyeri]|nr:pilin N-terminal domain-containing protein [Streptococcus hillyeri]
MVKKLIKILALVALLFSYLVPVVQVVRAEEAKTTNVTIHKIKLDNLAKWKMLKPQEDGTYVGDDGSIYNGNKLQNIDQYFGAGAEELSGVTFTYWLVKNRTQYEKMVKNPGQYDTVEKVKQELQEEGLETQPTGQSGVEVELLPGLYWVVENFGSYIGPNGETLSDSAAVPFGLELPAFNKDGNPIENLHVYPKNTITKPKIDKDFKGKANAEKPNKDKELRSQTVGDIVAYDIETLIPVGTRYATSKWSDQMTEGLTLNKDSFEVSIGGGPVSKTDYKLTTTETGFELELTKEGLNKVNGQVKETKIKISYSATVNKKVIVDIPESNDVTFHYGNNPAHGNSPIPTKPNNKQIIVEKQFSDGKFPEDVDVQVTLYNAQTGKAVEPRQVATLTKQQPTHTFIGLDNDTEYKVIETNLSGYSAEYKKVNQNGQIIIVNWKDNNPPPLTPEEPKIVTGGQRFRKVDKVHDNKALKGAEFVVKNKAGKYLARKDATKRNEDQNQYDDAEKKYQDLVKVASTSNGQELMAAKEARDNAYKTAKSEWKWVEQEKDAYIFISGENGYFHVSGLVYEAYELVEIKAPTGYAKLITPISFVVGPGSMDGVEIESPEKLDIRLKIIDNKKITIPQTGGIGTIIFAVGGAAIMAAALYAYFKNNKDEDQLA